MTSDFLFHAATEHQKKILLEFIKPISIEYSQKKDILSFDYFPTSKRLRWSVTFSKENSQLEKEFQHRWKLYLEEQASYFAPSTQTNITTLFKELPIDYLKISKTHTSTSSDPSNHRLSVTNLDVLQELDRNDYDLEFSICLLFTFIYCLGGFSPQQMFNISEQLKDYKQFDIETLNSMNAQGFGIISENQEAIDHLLDGLFHELLISRPDNAPSLFSTWKLGYGKIANGESKEIIPAFEHFKRQLLFSDSDTYMILYIIHNYFERQLENSKSQDRYVVLEPSIPVQ